MKITEAFRQKLADRSFAFPEQRKEPLEDANHVRNALARFDQVTGVTDEERDLAWKRIMAAAKAFGVAVNRNHWRDAHCALTKRRP
jgi:hypothetical protein